MRDFKVTLTLRAPSMAAVHDALNSAETRLRVLGGRVEPARIVERKSCPKCGGKVHRCKTAECLHCDNVECQHSWVPR